MVFFYANYRRIWKKCMKLPREILDLGLLRRANITIEETMIVHTSMNYDVKDTLYDQAKQSLKKLKGGVCSSSFSQQGAPSVKLEPAFLVENEEVHSLLKLGIDQDEVRLLTAQEHKDSDNHQ